MNTHDLWEAAALILGFQTASFAWRMAEESRVSRSGDVTWLPVADVVNLLSITTNALGVFVLPVSGYRLLLPAPKWFGLAILLFIGHFFALAGHYELFDIRHPRSMRFFPVQERVAILSIAAASLLYLLVVCNS